LSLIEIARHLPPQRDDTPLLGCGTVFICSDVARACGSDRERDLFFAQGFGAVSLGPDPYIGHATTHPDGRQFSIYSETILEFYS
jgi:hypothetical protein